jgi:MarR family transcriptional regulator, 2-MHQ and catechol-resistance regulon repressor
MTERRGAVEGREPKAGRAPSPEQVWVALSRAYRAMSLAVERSVAENGLGLTDFMLLEALLHKGPMTITEIQASVLLLATGSMTAAVDRLESKGLIARHFTEKDRRARVLELTADGRARIAAAYQAHKASLRLWLGALSPSERSLTFAALRKIEEHAGDQPT